MAANQFQLLSKKRFGPFFATQFLGAFNDNVFKNALIILLAYQSAELTAVKSDVLINLSAALFILPFFLFSGLAGQLADSRDKATLMRWVKALEIVVMLGAASAFLLLAKFAIVEAMYALIALLFLMGAQSSIFGPLKYGVLPQHLDKRELVGGNGMTSMGTFLAILLGTMLGGAIIADRDLGLWIISAVLVGLAIMGFISSLFIPPAPPEDDSRKLKLRPVAATVSTLKLVSKDKTTLLAILGISWFWFYGATYLTQLPNYTKTYLGGSEQVVTLLLTLFSLGVGIGALLCERLSHGRVDIGLVPLGSIGLTLFGLDIYYFAPQSAADSMLSASQFLAVEGSWRVLLDVLLLGTFGGFYIVPLNALIQVRAKPNERSQTIAANNICNSFFMVLSGILAAVTLGSGVLSIPQLFLLLAVFNAVVAIYIYSLAPEYLIRFIAKALVHTIYRMRKNGLDNIPEKGPVLLVCNHVSFMDAFVIGGNIHRPTRFVIDKNYYDHPLLGWFLRQVKTIPILSARENPDSLREAYEYIAKALEDGDVVCIFPEGGLTRDGELKRFKTGVNRILRRSPVPVVPMALQNLWGSFFSHANGPAMLRPPRRFWSRIGLAVGEPIAPEEAKPERLKVEIEKLLDQWEH